MCKVAKNIKHSTIIGWVVIVVERKLEALTINDEFLTMTEDINMGLFAEIKVFDLPTETAKKILKDYIEQDTGKKLRMLGAEQWIAVLMNTTKHTLAELKLCLSKRASSNYSHKAKAPTTN